MGAKTAISIEQYLETSFPDLDQEYVDGELVERSLPDNLHSKTQALLAFFFMAASQGLRLYPRTELRLRLSEGRVRIPNVSVFHPSEPQEAVPSTPPFIAIEILSHDDRMTEVRSKLEEYRDWGVAHVWLVDPYSKHMYTCDGSFAEVSLLRIPELDLELQPSDVFGRE
jgi:Uma2 family endonuclease